MTLPPGDPRHGKLGSYTNHKCRCDRCRKTLAAYQRDYTHRTGLHRPMAVYLAERAANHEYVHGTEGGYHRGCRCHACREASRLARARRRARSAA